ncbi:S-layer homology domain-containing protein [Brevibacillus sp. NRS-1366]|uniref:S-layer homology domain-containing protein n=1 Tax=Brevibacillus sp. NRS-1366 TaxID=3233899 RepID=UPI003D1FF6A7
MQKWKHSLRCWLSAVLTLLLLVTGVIPALPASAAPVLSMGDWTAIVNPGSVLKNSTDSNNFGEYASPVLVKSREITGIKLTNSKALAGNIPTVRVNGSTVPFTTPPSFDSSKVVTLPTLTLDDVSNSPTRVEVQLGTDAPAVMFYKFEKASSTGSLNYVIKPDPENSGKTGTSSNPIVTKSIRVINGMKISYNDPIDVNPIIEVSLNGNIIQTFTLSSSPKANNSGVSIDVSPFDLRPGLNTVRLYTRNTGHYQDLYYDFQSSNSPIALTDYVGQGTSFNNAVLHAESKITLRGVYGAGVTGSNLRLKIATNNGLNVQDLSSTAPSVNTSNNTFTFTDISLEPGMNVITFYEKMGSITREHFQFYVQYNNTPMIDGLSINGTPLTPSVTLITIPSQNRLTLSMDGKALNANTVEVKNSTTGDTVNGNVTKSGTFSLNLPSKLGQNDLEISAFNQNKKVGVIYRKIHVVTTDRDNAHQFYDVFLEDAADSTNKIPLKPDIVGTITGNSSPSNTSFKISGKALVQFAASTTQRFSDFKVDVKEKNSTLSWDIKAIGYSGSPTDKGSGFTEYDIASVINPTSPAPSFSDGMTYRVSLSYQYETLDTTTNLWVKSGYVPVNNYQYEFTYTNKNNPRFGNVTYVSHGLTKTLQPNQVNIVDSATLDIDVGIINMDNPAGSGTPPTASDFEVTYEGATINTLSNFLASKFRINLTNLPSGTGELIIKHVSSSSTVRYQLNVQNSPYVQLTYIDGTGQIRSFEDGYQIKSDDDIYTLSGRVYNYDVLNGASANIEVTVNNYGIVETDDSDPDTGNKMDGLKISPGKNGTFTIARSSIEKLLKKKGKGSHELVVRLTTQPSVSFTYNILYVTSKAPTISDIKLEIAQNNKSVELSKKPTDSAYQTGAHFLSNFSFSLNDAVRVYIEKGGKRIVDYRYEDGDWDLQDKNQDYLNTLREIPDGLQSEFSEFNFEPKSRTKFEARMKSSNYGDLIEEIQQEVKDQDRHEQTLSLFPLNLKKNGTTVYTIVAEDEGGSILRYDISIGQKSTSWEVLSPVKVRETDQYIIVNSNRVPIKVFAENATKVLFGKTQAVVKNTTERDFYYDDDLGKSIPESYYVFEATVPLKKGLNTIKYTVEVGTEKYNDQVLIYNANSSVDGAEYREVLGKKVSFSVFDKQFELKFPSGTVLLSPTDQRAGEEVKNPSGDIFVDVPLYFGIADRTTGQVNIPGERMKSKLVLERNFNYASPLFYVDAGDTEAVGGRDPYYEEGDSNEFRDRFENNLVPSRVGTVTIQYDTSIVNAANTSLTVYYNNGDGWRNIGGVVNTGKKVITVPFPGFGYFMVMKTRESFDDVVSHDYARDAMETLYAKGIMPSYNSSTFGANRDMTRGEFATMLVKAMDLPLRDGPYLDSDQRRPQEPTFNDVYPSRDTWDYQYKYIETAARAGIVRGKEPGYFRPDDSLTRQEAAIMIARALNLKLGTPEASKMSLAKMFTDGKDVGYYAISSVLAVSKAKLMNGEPNDPEAKKPTFRFNPNANLSRADMAVITIRVMVQLKKLPKQ